MDNPTRIPLITATIVLSFLGVVVLTFIVYCTVRACRKYMRRADERKRFRNPSSPRRSSSTMRAHEVDLRNATAGAYEKAVAGNDGSPPIFDAEAAVTRNELRKTLSGQNKAASGTTSIAPAPSARHRRRKHGGGSKDRSLRSQSLEYVCET